jgi:predicted nucleic-acid-binding protein
MIGLDTNVVVRYFTEDDPAQTLLAQELVEGLEPESPGFIAAVVLAELVWVLETSYAFDKEDIVNALDTLLRSKELVIERADVAWQALKRFRTSRADFSDCLIERNAAEAGCTHTVTFDRDAAKLAGMRLLA